MYSSSSVFIYINKHLYYSVSNVLEDILNSSGVKNWLEKTKNSHDIYIKIFFNINSFFNTLFVLMQILIINIDERSGLKSVNFIADR